MPAEFLRRQGQAGAHHEDGRQLSTKAPCCRRNSSSATCHPRANANRTMATPLAGAQAIPVSQRGVGKQDRPDRLGSDVEEGGLQRSLRFSGAPQTRRTSCKGNLCDDDLCRRNRNTPWYCQSVIARQLDRDLARGLHQGQRTLAPHKQAGQMTASNKDQRHKENTCNSGAVHK